MKKEITTTIGEKAFNVFYLLSPIIAIIVYCTM